MTLRTRLDLAPDITRLGIPVLDLGIAATADWPRAVLRLRRIVRGQDTDLIHTRLTQADFLGRLVAASCPGIRVMSTIEAPVYARDVRIDSDDVAAWKIQLVRSLDALTGRISGSHYVACSAAVAESTGRALRLPAARLSVIQNSVPVDALAPDRTASQPVARDDELRLLCVGRLSPQKGHRYLIAAMPAIVRSYPRSRLLLVGRGPLEMPLRGRVSDLGMDRHVEFLGLRDDVPSLMGSAHLLVMPSLWEGLSIVSLEALAAGLPAVASDIPSMREAFGDDDATAELVATRSPGRLAEAVVKLAGDPARRAQMSVSGWLRAKENFDVQTAAGRYLAEYRKVRDTKPGRGLGS